MCGFAGVLSAVARSSDVLHQLARGMGDALRHRGPDDSGTWVDQEAGVALSHRRLAIIDVSAAGHQPMLSACGRFVIVFNGEIYNYLELRRELEADGKAPAWRGHSDTEVLLACIAAWGLPRTLKRATGMFGMAVWDRKERTLSLARDRMGEKPVYYGWVQDDFAFGSELKAFREVPGFRPDLDLDALALYMQYRTVPAPYSIYRKVFKLPAASMLTLRWPARGEQSCNVEPYWSFAETVQHASADPLTDEQEALTELEGSLRAAVASQCIADVPLGAFLSGGGDSSLIVALMQAQSSRPVKTFTVGFDETEYDESEHARAVAAHLRTEHHELRVRPADARSVIPLLPRVYDEPFADSSQIPTYLICKAARANVTVALSGDAGDELFGGYNRYLWGTRLWDRMGGVPFFLRSMVGSMITAFPPAAWDRVGQALPGRRSPAQLGDKVHKVGRALQSVRSMDAFYRSVVSEWPEGHRLVRQAPRGPTQLADARTATAVTGAEHQMMLWDSLTYLPDDILTKVDRAAMAVSLETRVPFLDPGVVRAAWRLPICMKIRGGQGKWALREILYRHVPRELIERPKAGFAVPVGAWLRGPLRDWAEDLLDAGRLEQEGLIDAAPVRRAWTQHLSGRYDCTSRLWTVLMFQAWLREYS